MAVWRLQVNTGGTNVAEYCLKNHVAAMGWSLRELTQAERSGIHTFLDYCNLARTQYKSFDSVCRMVEDVKEGDLLWMRSRNESKSHPAVESTIWSMRGKGNGSLGQALLTSVKSIQSLHFPFALRTTTGLASHVGWSTPLTRPAASNFLISSAMNSWRSTACFLTFCLTGRA